MFKSEALARAPHVCAHLCFYGLDTEGNYYFARQEDSDIRRGGYALRDLNKNTLMKFCPKSDWQADFPKTIKDKEGNEVSKDVNWDNAIAWIIEEFRPSRYPMYNPSRVAGRGTWKDKRRFVTHLGNSLLIEGKEVKFSESSSENNENIYAREDEIIILNSAPLGLEDCSFILEFLEHFDFQNRLERIMVAGWIGIAFICGAFDWRPQVWVTANPGMGKSTLLRGIQQLLQVFHILFDSANTTEAAIRQTIGADAIPVIFDESEGNIEGVLSLIRSSSTGAMMAKGSPNQIAHLFRIQSTFLLASVVETLAKEADLQRFVVVNLQKNEKLSTEFIGERHTKVQVLAQKFTKEFSGRLFLRSVEKRQALFDSLNIFKNILEKENFTVREALQYATLLAGYWFLKSDTVVTREEAEAILQEFNFFTEVQQKKAVEEGSVQENLLDYLLRAFIEVGMDQGFKRITVGEALRHAEGIYTQEEKAEQALSSACQQALQRYGIRFFEGEGLFIANRNQSLAKLLQNSVGNENWNKVFKRFKGAKNEPKFIGKTVRGYLIPFDIKSLSPVESMAKIILSPILSEPIAPKQLILTPRAEDLDDGW